MVAKRFGAPLLRLPLCLESDQRLSAHPLNDAARQTAVGVLLNPLGIGLDDLELDRGGATVEDEDVHIDSV